MANEHLGKRRHKRINFQRPGFVILEPGGSPVPCLIVDIADGGACINVGTLELPKTFLLLLSAKGDVRRVCHLVWRRGDLAGVQFATAKDRKAKPKTEPETSAAKPK